MHLGEFVVTTRRLSLPNETQDWTRGPPEIEKFGRGTSEPRAIFEFGIRNFLIRRV